MPHVIFLIYQNTIFRAKQKILEIWILKSEESIFISKINTLEFSIMQKFLQKQTSLNLGPKSIFGMQFEIKTLIFSFCAVTLKTYLHIWNQRCQVCQNAKFRAKTRSLNLGPKIHYLGNCRPKYKKAIIIFEINILQFVKTQYFVQKLKNPRFGIRNDLLGCVLDLQF